MVPRYVIIYGGTGAGSTSQTIDISAATIGLAGADIADSFYVDVDHPSASDSNPGTESLPWATITKAAQTLVAGETCYVKEATGGYTNNSGNDTNPGNWNPTNSGTAGNPITFQNYPGHTPLLKNTNDSPTTPKTVIGSYGKNYITWSGFEVQVAGPKAVSIRGGATGCIVEYCNVHGNREDSSDNCDPVRVENATDTIIRYCYLHDSYNVGMSPNACGVKIYNSTRTTVHNCEVWDTISGIRNKQDGATSIFYRNFVHGLTTSYAFQSEQPDDEIYENIIYNCATGVNCKEESRPAVYQNTFVSVTDTIGGTGVNDGVSFYNNLSDGCGGHDRNFDTCSDNWYYNSTVECGSDGTTDPKFVDRTFDSVDDFKLQGDSPCKNQGSGGVDIGAYKTGSEQIGP